MHAPLSPVPRGRLAPSPTGLLHLGNAYAFLVAWLSVRSRGGSLVLRMEDLDPERSKPEYIKAVYADLGWLGLDCDEGPVRGGPCAPYEQSGRLDRYNAILDEFCRQGLAYRCYCTRRELRMLAGAPHVGDEGAPYPGTCRSLTEADCRASESCGRRPSLRLNTEAAMERVLAGNTSGKGAPAPGRHVPCAAAPPLGFTDAVLGEKRYTVHDCGGDFALRRSDGVVAYQLAVAADDAAMGVTEALRGEDLLLSTPRQILLFRLLGHAPPRYAHVPLLHDAQGERLAKRHKSLSLACLRDAGASPEGVVGYIAWLAGMLERPAPTRPGELLAAFSLARLRGRRLQLPEDADRRIIGLR